MDTRQVRWFTVLAAGNGLSVKLVRSSLDVSLENTAQVSGFSSGSILTLFLVPLPSEFPPLCSLTIPPFPSVECVGIAA